MSSQEDAQQQQREQLIADLRTRRICLTCYDLTSSALFGKEGMIYENELYKVVLEQRPRMRGHTIIVYKPHCEDISQLPEDKVGPLFQFTLKVIQALKKSLGAEKVYLNTMCDGPVNHLHLQLFPRYAGERIGSTRFVLPRQQLQDGAAIATQIRAELLSSFEEQ